MSIIIHHLSDKKNKKEFSLYFLSSSTKQRQVYTVYHSKKRDQIHRRKETKQTLLS
jgi:hypothetical protein